MTSHRQALLDEHLPGWRESPPQRQKSWPEVAAELRSYVDETGRLPGQSGDTPDERCLGAWLTVQRAAHHRAALEPARVAWLSANIPSWEGCGPRDLVWQQTARELSMWVTEVGRWPQRRNSSTDERRLAFWLKNRREDHRAGRLSAERIALLDMCVPGWRDEVSSSTASQA